MARTRMLTVSPDFTWVRPEDQPEALRAEAEGLRTRATEAEAAGLVEVAIRLRADADALAEVASKPPVTWHLRRPDSHVRWMVLPRFEERERDTGQRGGREVVRINLDQAMSEVLEKHVRGVDNLTDGQGNPVRYDPTLGAESRKMFWSRVPMEVQSDLLTRLIESCNLSEEDRKN